MEVSESNSLHCFFFFQAEDGIRDYKVTGVQTCALPIWIEIRPRLPVGGEPRLRVAVVLGQDFVSMEMDHRTHLRLAALRAMNAGVQGKKMGSGQIVDPLHLHRLALAGFQRGARIAALKAPDHCWGQVAVGLLL